MREKPSSLVTEESLLEYASTWLDSRFYETLRMSRDGTRWHDFTNIWKPEEFLQSVCEPQKKIDQPYFSTRCNKLELPTHTQRNQKWIKEDGVNKINKPRARQFDHRLLRSRVSRRAVCHIGARVCRKHNDRFIRSPNINFAKFVSQALH